MRGMLEDNLGRKENKREVQRLSFALHKPSCVAISTEITNQNLKEVILDNRQASPTLSVKEKHVKRLRVVQMDIHPRQRHPYGQV